MTAVTSYTKLASKGNKISLPAFVVFCDFIHIVASNSHYTHPHLNMTSDELQLGLEVF